MPGTSFDQVADIYDATRGGERRGNSFADALAPWVLGPRVVELGIGTGVIASGLLAGAHGASGHDVIGVDLSEAMLRHAQPRIGNRVAVADVDALPIADGSVDSVLFVWVLQLVDDPIATLREAARVLRPGGRALTILSNADDHPDDELAATLAGLAPLRRHRHGRDPLLAETPDSLRLVHAGHTPWDGFPSTPASQIEMIEQRQWSSLFEVDDHTWDAVVEPVLSELRSMPDPDRPRPRRNRHPQIVWER